MAVITKIRDRYAKLAGAVIGLSLVAFIISEGVSGSFQSLFSNDSAVAKVDGEAIEVREFTQMANDYVALSELFRRGQSMTEEEKAQIHQQVLEQLISERLIAAECKKLGIVVSDAEVKEMIGGQNPDPTIQQFYTTVYQSPQFDPGMVKDFEQQLKKNASEPQLQELGKRLESLKTIIIRGKLQQKYSSMMAASVYTPKAFAAYNAKEGARQAAFRFVKLPLTLIADDKVPVSDADVKDYMNKHKVEFTSEDPTRSIDYVVFDVKPNTEDTANALGELEKIRGEFVTTTGNEDFVNRYSEDRYTDAYVNKNRFQSMMADTILNSGVGTVVGPYFENGTYKMTKVIERRELPDSVKAQHILIATANAQNPNGLTDTLAHQRADSIFAAIKAGANFDTLAVKFSADGSKDKGGDLGYFGYGQMVPEFNEATFLSGKTGDLKEVKTQFGWHIIRINDQKSFAPATKLATITKVLNIGEKANTAEYNKANDFRSKAKDAAAFDATVRAQNLNKRVAEAMKPSDFVIQGLGGAREVIRWAYGAKQGEVSNPFILNNKYVVAKVSAINEPGLRAPDAALKQQLETVIRVEKKTKMLAEQYKNVSSLEALAQSSNQQIQNADSISATASFTPAIGYEPKVIGYAFNEKLALNAVSPAIRGRDGVFYISVGRRSDSGIVPDAATVAQQAQMADAQLKGYVGQSISQVLRRNAKVTYKPQNIL